MTYFLIGEAEDKCLNGDNCAGYCTLFGHSLLEKDLQRVPSATTQTGEKTSVVEKI